MNCVGDCRQLSREVCKVAFCLQCVSTYALRERERERHRKRDDNGGGGGGRGETMVTDWFEWAMDTTIIPDYAKKMPNKPLARQMFRNGTVETWQALDGLAD